MPTVVGVGATASGTGAVTPPYPAAYTAVADDVAVTFTECGNTDTLTPPTNWAQAAQATVNSGTTTKYTAIWRRLTAGESAPSIADAGNHIVGRMIVARGCVTGVSPIHIVTQTTELVADTSVSIPGFTTTVNDCLILAGFATGQDGQTVDNTGASGFANASLANVTERMDNWRDPGNGGGHAMASGEKATAGVVDAMTATLLLTANFKALIMIALQGAATVATAPILQRWDRNLGTLVQM